MDQICTHVNQVREVEPKTSGCEECLPSGDAWVELRVCMTCGHIGCCDSSKGKHATQHFQDTGHPIMRSIDPGPSWAWCYVDQIKMEVPEPLLAGAAGN